MFCKYCGNELQDLSNFCTKCGMRAAETAPAPVPPVQEQAGQVQTQESAERISTAQESAEQEPAQESVKWTPPVQNTRPRRKGRLLVPVCIAGTAAVVLIAVMIFNIGRKTGASSSADGNSGYAQQGGGAGQSGGGSRQDGNTGYASQGGGDGENQSGGNANNSENGKEESPQGGGNFGIDTSTALKPDEYYTSEKTGTTFVIPSEAGYAQISIDGVVNDVPAKFYENIPSRYINCHRRVYIYIDGKPKNSEQYLIWNFSLGSKWETGGSYGLNDVCSSHDWVNVTGVYRHYYPIIDQYTSGVDTQNSDFWEYFDDASFQVISLSADGLYDEKLKCYFYLEISDGSSSHIIEGVANLQMEI